MAAASTNSSGGKSQHSDGSKHTTKSGMPLQVPPWSRVARLQAYHTNLFLQASRERKRKDILQSERTRAKEAAKQEAIANAMQTQSLGSIRQSRTRRSRADRDRERNVRWRSVMVSWLLVKCGV